MGSFDLIESLRKLFVPVGKSIMLKFFHQSSCELRISFNTLYTQESIHFSHNPELGST